jgi:hypothetical protein
VTVQTDPSKADRSTVNVRTEFNLAIMNQVEVALIIYHENHLWYIK